MIRRKHYRCLCCGAFEYQHEECSVALNEKDERPCGEAFHVHCTKCSNCDDFRVDWQHEDDLYAEAQERKYEEWRDRQMERDDEDTD